MMKKTDVQVGTTYLVKVANNLVPVKISREHSNGGWEGVSAKSGKTIRIKSAQRLRRRLGRTPTVATQNNEPSDDATAAPERDTGERVATRGNDGGKRLSLLDAAAQVLAGGNLRGSGLPGAMRCKDIVDLAVERGLWARGQGKTPANTLYAAILREINTKGNASRFVKAERGKFALANDTGQR